MFAIIFSFFKLTITLLLLIFAIFYLYCRHQYGYWKKRGLYSPKTAFPYGNTKDTILGREAYSDSSRRIYQQIKASGNKHGGAFYAWQPFYYPVDPEIMKSILTKDFNHFVDRGLYVDEEVDPINAHLANLEGQSWKLLRQKLTPTFTSGKMKMMWHTLLDCGDNLIEAMNEKIVCGEPVNIKDMLSLFMTDVIGSCAFGIECNSLKNPSTEFRIIGKIIFEPNKWDMFKITFAMMYPNFYKKLRIPISNAKVADFFSNIVRQTVDYREKNCINRKDFMQLLIELKNHGYLIDTGNNENIKSKKAVGKITMNQVIAQAYLFFTAGFETSSTTLQFLMYEIAVNIEMQQRLREEILENMRQNEGNLTYEGMQELKYLDMFISETLRIYPPVCEINRLCTSDYKIPGTNVIIDKGTFISIPVWAIQMDPEYFPEPEKFDPERFCEENKSKRHPYTWIPFGEGPRNCIGMRFGLMQIKLAVVLLISNYKLTLNPKTKTPLKMDPKCLLFSPIGGVWIDFEKHRS